MSLTITYSTHLQPNEIIGRLLGPDTTGAFVQAINLHYDIDTNKTRVDCRPVPQHELAHLTRDSFGYYWLPLPGSPALTGENLAIPVE